MNIVLVSHAFAPSVGGIETVSENLAQGLSEAGHRVTVVTRTSAGPTPRHESGLQEQPPKIYGIVRAPTWHSLFGIIREADVVLHNNPALRLIWPSLLLRKPTVISHHTWLAHGSNGRSTRAWLKAALCRRFPTIAVSHVIADELPWPVTVIPNGYDDSVFHPGGDTGREPFILFVGRLVSDKGCHLLVEAFARARETGQIPTDTTLMVAGDGPDRATLEELARDLGLIGTVQFLGAQKPAQVADLMRRASAVAVPSLWREPFGLVALEAAACGVLAIVPDDTGLTEAAGPAAITFRRGELASLTSALATALRTPADADRLRRHAAALSRYNQVVAYETTLAGTAHR